MFQANRALSITRQHVTPKVERCGGMQAYPVDAHPRDPRDLLMFREHARAYHLERGVVNTLFHRDGSFDLPLQLRRLNGSNGSVPSTSWRFGVEYPTRESSGYK